MPAALGFSTYVAIAPQQDQKLRINLRNFPVLSNSMSRNCRINASERGVTT